jgi:hypothetical protein
MSICPSRSIGPSGVARLDLKPVIRRAAGMNWWVVSGGFPTPQDEAVNDNKHNPTSADRFARRVARGEKKASDA